MANLPSSISLSNLTAIVTGGSRGIGKDISLELARRGADVAIIYVNPAIAEIKTFGVKAVAIQADLKDPSALDRIVKETLKALVTEKIDILGMQLFSSGCSKLRVEQLTKHSPQRRNCKHR
jgi:NAD(P)-dependent dehydrogenase (short-subunit alcohol dehydrogenase family)